MKMGPHLNEAPINNRGVDVNINNTISQLKVTKGTIGVFWLGNASFILKTPSNRIIGIDLYFSDLAEKVYGYTFRRLMPSPVEVKDLKVDFLLATHHHEDHLDLDTLPELISNGTKVISTYEGIRICKENGIDNKQLIEVENGDVLDFEDVRVHTVFADHGDLAPDAVGFVVESAGLKIYNTGDTAYRPNKMSHAFSMKPDLVIQPINGKYGNLNPEEASYVVRDSGARFTIPSHFWMFPGHNGDPGAFYEAVDKNAPDADVIFLTQGAYYLLNK
jgi:L-ascorbate 6-phosphate lactonase